MELPQFQFKLLLALCLAVALIGALPAQAETDTTRPNIILVIADDVSWNDIGVYGHPTIRTPELDDLAAKGMRLTMRT